MTHLDEGTIVSIRDGSLVPGDARWHAQECSVCQQELSEARRRAEVIEDTLLLLDSPSGHETRVDVDAAKAAVRRRLDSAQSGRTRPRRPWYFGKAAAALVVTAGAAAALPNSPVREWFATAEPREAAETATTGQEARIEGGIEVSVPEGGIRVSVNDMTEGSDLEVVWIEASTARIVAGAGSTFSYADGRAQASVVAGPVRVELPRDASEVSIDVDGRTYLRRTADGLVVLGPIVEQTEDRIRFLIPER